MSRQIEIEAIEHLIQIIGKLTEKEDKFAILSLFCEHSMAVGEIEGMKIALKLREKP